MTGSGDESRRTVNPNSPERGRGCLCLDGPGAVYGTVQTSHTTPVIAWVFQPDAAEKFGAACI